MTHQKSTKAIQADPHRSMMRSWLHLGSHSQEEAHHAHGPTKGQGADVALHVAHGVVDGQAGHHLRTSKAA